MFFAVPMFFLLASIVLTVGHAAVQTGTRQRVRAFPWVIALTVVLLVYSQLLWLVGRVRPDEPYRHLRQVITRGGLERACTASLVFAVAMWFGLLFRAPLRRRVGALVVAVNLGGESPRRRSRALMGVGTGTLLILVALAGGPVVLLTTPGVIIPSQALLLAIGRLPLLLLLYPNLALRRRVAISTWAYSGVFVVVLLLNSRILFTFEVLSFGFLRLWHSPRARSLVFSAVVMTVASFLVFFAYGTYRERASNPESRVAFLSSGPALSWFYGKNVEAGVGLAGILSRPLPPPDLGSRTIRAAAVQLVPGPIRSSIGVQAPQSRSGSVIPGALEDAYLALRFAGIALLGILVGGVGAAVDYFGRNPLTSAATASLAPFSLLLVRGSLRDVIVFGLSQVLLMIAVKRLVFGGRPSRAAT